MRAPDAKTWVRVALVLVAAAFVAYMILIPAVDAILSSFREQPKKIIQIQNDMTLAEKIRLRTIEGVTAFWFFAFGAAIGSFLNVVVYRMPMGESLVFRRSRCPMCGTQISGRDNVPILGWLMLGGRCRTCGDSISLRYPTIELIVGSLFLLLYFAELISGGMNLPIRRPNDYAGVVWIIFYTKWDLVTIYLFHCAMLSLLLALALIDLDGKRLPMKSLVLFGLLLAVPACLFPQLLLVKLPLQSFGASMPTWAQPLVTVLAGAAFGLLGAIAISAAIRQAAFAGSQFGAGLVLIGICLGWQAVLASLVITLVLKLGAILVGKWGVRERLPEEAFADLPQVGGDAVDAEAVGAEPVDAGAVDEEAVEREANATLVSNRVPTRVRALSLPLSMYLFIAAAIHQFAWRWLFPFMG